MKLIDIYERELTEGPYDPNTFKAIFLAGGPGSGKSTVSAGVGLSQPVKKRTDDSGEQITPRMDTITGSLGLKVVNSDTAFEMLMRKHGLDFKMPPHEQERRDELRGRAKRVAGVSGDTGQFKNWLDGRLGVVIDGTGRDADKISRMKSKLESMGYQTAMLFVNTDLETALIRNRRRARSVPDEIVQDGHEGVQNSLPKLKQLFGDTFFEINNNEGVSPDYAGVEKRILNFLRSPITDQAQQWIQQQTGGVTESQVVIAEEHDSDIDIPRDQMPQINISHLEGKHELKHTQTSLSKLKPSQSERVPGKVNSTAAAIERGELDKKPLIVDRRGYVVNGHHRYDAYKKLGYEKVPIIVVLDATVYDLMDEFSDTTSDEPVESVNEVIRKTPKGYVLYSKSKKGGKRKKLGGPYKSRAGAEKRERQVQYFKHKGESVCPRTKAALCECESVTTLTESEETVQAVCELEHSDTVRGTILFSQTPGEPTTISGKISGLDPNSVHGFHIHEYGDLSGGCETAGGHYNPFGKNHGGPDDEERHVGDLGNLETDEQGSVSFEMRDPLVQLTGEHSVIGRSVVVHADADDLGRGGDAESLKTGNAGERLACGVISLASSDELSEAVQITELFDLNKLRPANKRQGSTDTFVSYTTELPDGTDLDIYFVKSTVKDRLWRLTFDRDGRMSVTGAGNEILVFGTVLATVADFINSYNPVSLEFRAEKARGESESFKGSRERLYSRLVNRFIPNDYQVSEKSDWSGTIYTIVRTDSIREPEEKKPRDPDVDAILRQFGESTELTELFDKPVKFTKFTDTDSMKAYRAGLSDGSMLVVFFSYSEIDQAWNLDFHRNGSTERTGQGNEITVFSTVLAAAKQFIEEHQPDVITFSAFKESPGDSELESREKLYSRLVKRFAGSMGYDAEETSDWSGSTWWLERDIPSNDLEQSLSDSVQYTAEAEKRKKKPGSQPGSIRRKASQYLGKGVGKDGVSKTEAKRLLSKARKMKKSNSKAQRDRGIQLERQARWVLNMGGGKK